MRTQHRAAHTIASLLIAACAHSAGAAAPNGTGNQAWRCGSSYSDQPCAGGRAVAVDDARSAADRQSQDRHTRETQRQAETMARERRALEREAAQQRPAIIAPPPAPAARAALHETMAKPPKTHKPKKHAKGETDAFSARDPSAAPTDDERRKKKSKKKG
jgi:hypothetical protein